MSALLERQRALAAALTGGAPGIAEHVIGDAIPAEQRVQVYANHFRISLLETLASTFPVTRALVGEAFFAQTARAFIAAEQPVSPLLAQYGSGFPGFLAAQPDLGAHNYLPDVAAFEWALNVAYFAADVELLRPEDLPDPDAAARLPLTLHPSVQRLSTPFPVSEIWQVHQPDAPAIERIDMNGGGERLLIWRKEIDVCWRRLDPGEDCLLAELGAGQPLGSAAMAAAAHEAFDFPASFSWMLDGGIFARTFDSGIPIA
ncbi:MAG TPA: DNA-binding domain-containing protein [Alphaproteobacteria bacterium]